LLNIFSLRLTLKKILFVVLMVVFIFTIVFISIPKSVQAGLVSATQSLAAGTWNTGTVIDVDLTAAPAPEWLKLMTTEAVVVKEPTQLCHELGGGKFHWVGEIRKLMGDRWVKLETTSLWYPDEEGAFMVCAQAPSAGTYALFAYYNGPQEYFPIIIEPTVIPQGTPKPCEVGDSLSTGCICYPPKVENKGICIAKQL